MQYGYNDKKIISLKAEIGKPLSSHCYANIYYENNYKSQFQSIGVGFRYDFSYGQLTFSARHGDHITTTTQAARGSMIYDATTDYVGFSNRTNVGKAGIAIVPFLDFNCNGKRTDGFENISWQLKKKVLNIGVGPNQVRLVEVPVCVQGEVSGTVYISSDKERKGLGRMTVSFYNNDGALVAHTLTEADGFFSYLGLPPGSYYAMIDSAQLNKLHFSSTPKSIPFTIRVSRDGEVLDGLDFLLLALPGNTSAREAAMRD